MIPPHRKCTCESDILCCKVLPVLVDKRMTMRQLKVCLEPYMLTTSENFKVFRVYSNNQEFECTRLSDTLSTYDNETKVSSANLL